MSVTIVNAPIPDPSSGEPLTTGERGPGEGRRVPLTPALAARDFLKCVFVAVRNAQWSYLTDLRACDRVLRAAREAGKVLVLDTGDHEWLRRKLEEHGAAVFGCHTAAVHDAMAVAEGEKKK